MRLPDNKNHQWKRVAIHIPCCAQSCPGIQALRNTHLDFQTPATSTVQKKMYSPLENWVTKQVKKTPKSLVRFARLKPVTIFSQCKQFIKLLSLKENFSKISEAKQWHTRSEREKRKKMSTFSYSFISLEALQDVKKIQFLTSNRPVSKTCVILLLWNRRKGETVLISDYSNKVREYF